MPSSRPSSSDVPLILVWLLSVSAFLVFAKVADEVIEGKTGRFDMSILAALRSAGDASVPIGPIWLQEMARDVTALGSPPVLFLFVGATAGFLLLLGLRRDAGLMVGAIGGGQLLTLVTKAVFGRPRPAFGVKAMHLLTTSFPSGHAAMAALTYLTLAALASRLIPTLRLRMYVMGLALGVTVVVGLSRIYLGVHWPTDVVAGWAFGSAWGLLCWAIARTRQ